MENTIHKRWNQKALCDFEGEAFTYADLATSIEQFRIFLSDAGITKRNKIAICARNSARWALTFWDINVNGCVAVPLLAEFHPNSVTTLTQHSDSVMLFTEADIWQKLNPERIPAIKAAVNIKDGSLLWHRDEKVANAWKNREKSFARLHPNGLQPEQVSYATDNMDKLAIINYTSGTTGNPKGVMLTYGAISDTDEFSNSHFPNQPGETIVSMLPMAHMYGLAIEFIHPNVDGVTVYYLGKTPSPTRLLKAMREVRPYMVVTVPLVMEKIYASSIQPTLVKMQRLFAVPYAKKLIYKIIRRKILSAFGGKVRCFIMGGAPLKPEVEQCFCEMRCWDGSGGRISYRARVESPCMRSESTLKTRKTWPARFRPVDRTSPWAITRTPRPMRYRSPTTGGSAQATWARWTARETSSSGAVSNP